MDDRRFYVYGQRDPTGNLFYVGKGTGRRAWSQERHPVWQRYVRERLRGGYTVEILKDRLTEIEAELLEHDLISKHGNELVNWNNPGRPTDLKTLARFHELRDANRAFVAATKTLETIDPDAAVLRYRQAIARIREYDELVFDTGVVAELSERLRWGEPVIIDRLTLCLSRLGRWAELDRDAEEYFARYPDSLVSRTADRVMKRVTKARARIGDSAAV